MAAHRGVNNSIRALPRLHDSVFTDSHLPDVWNAPIATPPEMVARPPIAKYGRSRLDTVRCLSVVTNHAFRRISLSPSLLYLSLHSSAFHISNAVFSAFNIYPPCRVQHSSGSNQPAMMTGSSFEATPEHWVYQTT